MVDQRSLIDGSCVSTQTKHNYVSENVRADGGLCMQSRMKLEVGGEDLNIPTFLHPLISILHSELDNKKLSSGKYKYFRILPKMGGFSAYYSDSKAVLISKSFKLLFFKQF